MHSKHVECLLMVYKEKLYFGSSETEALTDSTQR